MKTTAAQRNIRDVVCVGGAFNPVSQTRYQCGMKQCSTAGRIFAIAERGEQNRMNPQFGRQVRREKRRREKKEQARQSERGLAGKLRDGECVESEREQEPVEAVGAEADAVEEKQSEGREAGEKARVEAIKFAAQSGGSGQCHAGQGERQHGSPSLAALRRAEEREERRKGAGGQPDMGERPPAFLGGAAQRGGDSLPE